MGAESSSISRRVVLSGGVSVGSSWLLPHAALAQTVADDEQLSTDPGVLATIKEFYAGGPYLIGPDGRVGKGGQQLQGLGLEALAGHKVLEPFTWPWVGVQLAGGVVAYIGGGIFAKIIGEPSMGELAKLIREAVEEIKAFIREELRRALAETVLLDLEARTAAVHRNLKRYAGVPAANRRDYRYLIEAADLDTSGGIALAEKYTLSALPVYANFVSLRALTMKAFYEIDRKRPPMRAFADEFTGYRKYVSDTLTSYGISLDPEKRLAPLACEWAHHGGQFPISYYQCCFKEDGRNVAANCTGATQGDSSASSIESLVNQRAAVLRKTKAEQLALYRQSSTENFLNPLAAMVGKWDQAIAEIKRRYS